MEPTATSGPSQGAAAEARPSPLAPGHVGLFANRFIPAGSEILSVDKPLVSVVEAARLIETCSNCNKWVPEQMFDSTVERWGTDSGALTLSKCSGCYTLSYCGKACQAEAWKNHHKLECKVYKRLRPNILPTFARAMLRVLLIRDKGIVAEETWQAFRKLQTHEAEFRTGGGDRWEEVCLASKAIRNWSGADVREDAVRELCCKIRINSHTLTTATFEPLGMFLDVTMSSVNHSCAPNAVILCDGRRMSIRSIGDINVDEEVLISYIDCTEAFRRRQAALEERYFFACRCVKCEKGPALREDRFLADEVDISTMNELEDKLFDSLDFARNRLSTPAAFNKLRGSIQRMKKTSCWPLHRQPSPAVRQELVADYLCRGKWTPALKHLLKIYLHIDPILYPETWHPVRVVHLWTLTVLMLHLAYLSQTEPDRVKDLGQYGLDSRSLVLALVMEVVVNIPKSHGPDSSFTKRVSKEIEGLGLGFDLFSAGPTMADVRESRADLAQEWLKLGRIADSVD